MEDLDGDVAIDPRLKGAIHTTHRADPHERLDPDLPGQLEVEVGVGLPGASTRGASRERAPVERAVENLRSVLTAAGGARLLIADLGVEGHRGVSQVDLTLAADGTSRLSISMGDDRGLQSL
jgi:hypothetical protein